MQKKAISILSAHGSEMNISDIALELKVPNRKLTSLIAKDPRFDLEDYPVVGLSDVSQYAQPVPEHLEAPEPVEVQGTWVMPEPIEEEHEDTPVEEETHEETVEPLEEEDEEEPESVWLDYEEEEDDGSY